MLSSAKVKLIRSLSVKKYRTEAQMFVVEGEKMVAELLRFAPAQLAWVYGLEDWAQRNPALLKKCIDKFTPVQAADLEKISAMQTPNAVLALVRMPSVLANLDLPTQDICLYLDGIQDPGNLGTILRIAEWFGIKAIYTSPDTVDLYSPKVVQASMGALFRVSFREIALEALLLENPVIPILGAVLEGDSVFSAKSPQKGLLVIGNEGRGIRADLLPLITQKISIPRHPAGGAESLNAAVATGILAAWLRNV
jgi:RNA methyltransferase, TrmH family